MHYGTGRASVLDRRVKVAEMTESRATGTPLPKIGRPATAALEQAGHDSLEELTRITEQELLAMHGVGRKAVRLLKEAMAAKGLSFKSA
jgi:hypothetical protein